MAIFGTILPIRKNVHFRLSLLVFNAQKADNEKRTEQVAGE